MVGAPGDAAAGGGVTRPIILSDRALRQLARVRDAQRELAADGTGRAALGELAARARLPVKQVQTLLVLDQPPRSLDEPLADEEGQLSTLGEVIVDPLAEGEYERVLDAIETEELRTLLSSLSEREREILRAGYGVDGEAQSLGEVAAGLGVSAERVRQLEQRALGKLYAVAESDEVRGSGGADRPLDCAVNRPMCGGEEAEAKVRRGPSGRLGIGRKGGDER